MQKILRIYRYTQHNKMYYIKSSYYISYKLGYTEFIDFDELDEFYINKLKYCVLLLLTDDHVKINNEKINFRNKSITNNIVVKYYNILGKLPMDLQLLISGLITIKNNDIKRCINFLLK